MKQLMLLRPAKAATVMLFLSATGAFAQKPVTWSLKPAASGKQVRPGSTFKAQVTARVEDGWHLYALDQPEGGPNATRIELAEGQPFALAGKVKAPQSKTAFDQNFGIETRFYEISASFTLQIKVANNAKPGKHPLKVNAYFQTCNDRICLQPQIVNLSETVDIGAGHARAKQAG